MTTAPMGNNSGKVAAEVGRYRRNATSCRPWATRV